MNRQQAFDTIERSITGEKKHPAIEQFLEQYGDDDERMSFAIFMLLSELGEAPEAVDAILETFHPSLLGPCACFAVLAATEGIRDELESREAFRQEVLAIANPLTALRKRLEKMLNREP